jgi:uncharacterized protein YoaH (UPF0181 family)
MSDKISLAKEELIKYGFGSQESERICLGFRNPTDRDYVNAIRENNSFLEQLGFSKEEVIRFVKSLYSFYDLDTNYIQEKINEIISLGVSKEEAIKLCKTTSIFGTRGSSKEHMEDVISLGYSKDDSLNMLKEDYNMYLNLGVSKNQWDDLFNKLSQLGFEKNELLDMLKKHEIKYSYIAEYASAFGNLEVAKNAIDKLLEQGVTKSEAINEYEKLYRAMRQQETQRRYDESQEPDKGMSR